MTIAKLREITVLCNQQVQSDAWYSLVRISPFRKGQALTVASTLRRLLLQEVGTFGITTVTLHAPNDRAHEFSTLSGIQESLPELTNNLRTVQFLLDKEEEATVVPQRATLVCRGRATVTAGDFELPMHLRAVNPRMPIATLVSPYAHLDLEVEIGYAKTYTSYLQDVRPLPQLPLRIPITPPFSPVRRVNYVIKHTPTYEFILFELWTDGSVQPDEALAEASFAAKQVFQPFL